MMTFLKFSFFILLVILITGCATDDDLLATDSSISPDTPPMRNSQPESQPNSPSNSAQGREPQREMQSNTNGQYLPQQDYTFSDGFTEVTIHDYEFSQNLGKRATASGDSKFVVLNLTIKDLGTLDRTYGAEIYPYFMQTRWPDPDDGADHSNPFRQADCGDVLTVEKLALETDLTDPAVEEYFMDLSALLPGESRSGLLACITDAEASKLWAAWRTRISGAVEHSVQIYDRNEVIEELNSTANIGDFKRPAHSMLSFKVNNVLFLNNPTYPADLSTSDSFSHYRNISSTTFECGMEDAIFGGTRSANPLVYGVGYCSYVIVDITVKNEVDLPWERNFNIAAFKLRFGNQTHTITREHNSQFYEALDKPLDLQNMRQGEERTGQLIYHVGEGIVLQRIPMQLVRSDGYKFGTHTVHLVGGMR